MFNSLWVAKTGMEAQDTRVATIANNMANASTTAFKKDMAHFTSLGYTEIRGNGASNETGDLGVGSVSIGRGVQMGDTSKIYTQGSVKETGSETDFMVGGEGYFVLLNNNDEAYYTRDGHFEMVQDAGGGQTFNMVHVATNMKLAAVAADTNGVVDNINFEALKITPPTGQTEIGPLMLDRDGQVLMQTSVGDEPMSTAQFIPLARFGSKSGLVQNPGGAYKDDATRTGGASFLAGLPTAGFGNVRHKALEVSNVTVIDEMVDMIEAQRGYEMGAKVLEKTDEMMSTLIQRT